MGFAPEDRLIVMCSRGKMSDETIAKASCILKEDLDWKYLLETSIRQGVSPLFYNGLKQMGQSIELKDVIPLSFYQELKGLYLGNCSRNQRLYRVLKEIVEEFDRAGVPVMGLKDIQLAREVYADIGLRPMGDLDLLIHQQDYDRAAVCMRRLGFAPLPSADIPYTLKYAWAHHWQRPADNVWIDLQWNVLQLEWDTCGEGSFDFEIERMWRGAVRMEFEGAQIWVPGLEDMLFHLCLHLEGHRYAEWILFCDIAEFIQRYEGHLDWQYLIHLAHRYQVESSIYYVLLLVSQVCDISLPPSLLEELEPAYMKASLFQPLFGNLTYLHVSLDEIRQAIHPPLEVMSGYEAAVRLQAFSAMQFYREIDQIVAALMSQGGDLAILDGEPSPRIIPDPLLEPFGEIRLIILEQDRPRLQQVFSSCGFQTVPGFDPETYKKTCEFLSRDPALDGRPVRMMIEASVTTDFLAKDLLSKEGGELKKRVALRLLKDKLAGRERLSDEFPVRLKVVALAPEDVLVCLAARLGATKQDRLFRLINLLEFFRCYHGPIDWNLAAQQGRLHGAAGTAGEGLSIASEIIADNRLPRTALFLFSDPVPQPRVLELARYSDESLGLYRGFKAPFYFSLSLLSIRGFFSKCRYLFRSMVGNRELKPILPRLIYRTSASLISNAFKNKKPTITDMVYWIESSPEVVIETESS